MQAVNISDLRANLLDYLRQASEGKEIVVTSRGREIATLAPPPDKIGKARAELKRLAQTAQVGDVTSPVEAPWKADV